jgi:hypothetical protein
MCAIIEDIQGSVEQAARDAQTARASASSHISFVEHMPQALEAIIEAVAPRFDPSNVHPTGIIDPGVGQSVIDNNTGAIITDPPAIWDEKPPFWLGGDQQPSPTAGDAHMSPEAEAAIGAFLDGQRQTESGGSEFGDVPLKDIEPAPSAHPQFELRADIGVFENVELQTEPAASDPNFCYEGSGTSPFGNQTGGFNFSNIFEANSGEIEPCGSNGPIGPHFHLPDFDPVPDFHPVPPCDPQVIEMVSQLDVHMLDYAHMF